MSVAIAILILAFYPYALSIGASDLDRGQTYTVTVSAPAGASVSVQAPAWISVTPLEYVGGDTFKAVLHVAPDAPDTYGRVVLLVGGIPMASQGVRVGMVRTTLIYLPIISASP
jgi:hypothetical protein